MTQEHIIVGMTGASGAAYGLRLIQRLVEADVCVHLLLSDAARVVLKQECALDLPQDQAGTVYIGLVFSCGIRFKQHSENGGCAVFDGDVGEHCQRYVESFVGTGCRCHAERTKNVDSCAS